MNNMYVWSEAVYSIIGSVTLFLFSFLCIIFNRSLIAPATVYSLTWAATLLFASITPLLGFNYLTINAVFFYVAAAILFSTVSIVSYDIFRKVTFGDAGHFYSVEKIHFVRLLLFFNVLGMIAYPLLIVDLMKHGDDIKEIAFNVRMTVVGGEKITSPFVANYLLFGYFCTILFIYGSFRCGLNKVVVFLSIVPVVLSSLILGGRSGVTSIILASFFVTLFSNNKIKIKWIFLFAVGMLLVLYLGAILVNKVDVSDQGFIGRLIVLFEHMAGYLFQGPVLFSEYLEKNISVRENWNTLNSVCHVLSKIDLCEPILQHHADFAPYGNNRAGNVYTFYFALLPHYSYLGTAAFLILYSLLITGLYARARSGGIFSLVASSFLFGAIVLTMFKDGIGYSFWMMLKFLFFTLVVCLFFYKESPFHWNITNRKRIIRVNV